MRGHKQLFIRLELPNASILDSYNQALKYIDKAILEVSIVTSDKDEDGCTNCSNRRTNGNTYIGFTDSKENKKGEALTFNSYWFLTRGYGNDFYSLKPLVNVTYFDGNDININLLDLLLNLSDYCKKIDETHELNYKNQCFIINLSEEFSDDSVYLELTLKDKDNNILYEV